MKKIPTIFIISLLVAIAFTSSIQSTVAKPAPEFPVDAGGPYIGLASHVPVQFEGWADPGPGHYIEDWLWDFGDETTSDQEDPVHMYQNPFDGNAYLYAYDEIDRYGWDSAEVEIFSNDWVLTVEVWHKWLRHRFLLGGPPQPFCVNVFAALGDYDDSPPFDLVVELWDIDAVPPHFETIVYSDSFGSLAPGHAIGVQEFSYPTYEVGEFEMRAKVLFLDSTYELCEYDDWWFRVFEL